MVRIMICCYSLSAAARRLRLLRLFWVRLRPSPTRFLIICTLIHLAGHPKGLKMTMGRVLLEVKRERT